MSADEHASKQWVKTKEVATAYDVHPNTVLNLYRKGMIPGHRLGPRTLRFDLAEVGAARKHIRRDESVLEILNRILAEAPPLNDEQRSRITELLRLGIADETA